MRKGLLATAIVLVGAFAFIGWMHTPGGRSLLGDSCPFETVERSPGERDEARRAATRRLAGSEAAGSRRLGEVELGVTTRTELTAWARRSGGECRDARGGGMRCTTADEVVAAELSSDARVVALSRTRRTQDAEAALDVWEREVATLRASLGEPDRSHGEATLAHLGAGRLAQTRAEFRRSDLFAAVSATRLGDDRYTVVSTYRAIE